ncbi:MAG: phospholipase D-like domain-containing protein [Nitrosopumilus sp.]|nr:phospholipase D-like domain-containing protein [Nitrosopumilus sp.]MDH3487042.1 phospholipase D-like domain-containing protein [Nitrosopumilus sp.]
MLHSKIFLIDDEFAIIGTANCNNRGYTHDNEVAAGIYGTYDKKTTFAQELRIRLWMEHLDQNREDLVDPIASVRHWSSPSSTAKIAKYDPDGGSDPFWQRLIPESIIDPDGS